MQLSNISTYHTQCANLAQDIHTVAREYTMPIYNHTFKQQKHSYMHTHKYIKTYMHTLSLHPCGYLHTYINIYTHAYTHTCGTSSGTRAAGPLAASPDKFSGLGKRKASSDETCNSEDGFRPRRRRTPRQSRSTQATSCLGEAR